LLWQYFEITFGANNVDITKKKIKNEKLVEIKMADTIELFHDTMTEIKDVKSENINVAAGQCYI